MNGDEWAQSILEDFRVYEDREMPWFPLGREHALIVWALKCLSNPQCPGSDEAMRAVNQRYSDLLGGGEEGIERIGAHIHRTLKRYSPAP